MPGNNTGKVVEVVQAAKDMIDEMLYPSESSTPSKASSSKSNTDAYEGKVKAKIREVSRKGKGMTEEKVDVAERVMKNQPLIVVGTDLLSEVLMKEETMSWEDRERQIAVAHLALLSVQGTDPVDDNE